MNRFVSVAKRQSNIAVAMVSLGLLSSAILGVNACTEEGAVTLNKSRLAQLEDPRAGEDTTEFLVGDPETVIALRNYLDMAYTGTPEDDLYAAEVGLQQLDQSLVGEVLSASLGQAQKVYEFEPIIFLMSRLPSEQIRPALMTFLTQTALQTVWDEATVDPHDARPIRDAAVAVYAVTVMAKLVEQNNQAAEADMLQLACQHELRIVRRRAIAELQHVGDEATRSALQACVGESDRFQLGPYVALGTATTSLESLNLEPLETPAGHTF